MSREDLSFAIQLTNTVNWDLDEDDFKFMMRLEPEGCFILLLGSERIGLATTISFHKVGWIGNVIISENHREKGAGSLLVKHAVKYLTNKQIETVGLYAYDYNTSFYRRLGFAYDSDFVVLKGESRSRFSAASETKTIKTAYIDDLSEIEKCDNLCFGDSRHKLLCTVLQNSSNLCYTHVKNSVMTGFVLAKVYDTVAELGPLVCQERQSDVALSLLKTALKRLEFLKISVCVSEKESEIVNALKMSGFSEDFRVARMFYGHQISSDCIYIPESLERG
jgi:predicted GNAT family N-acyltransferase